MGAGLSVIYGDELVKEIYFKKRSNRVLQQLIFGCYFHIIFIFRPGSCLIFFCAWSSSPREECDSGLEGF